MRWSSRHPEILFSDHPSFNQVAVHITGYITYASMEDEDEEDERAFMGGMDDEDEDEDLDEAEEEEYDEDEDGEDEDEDDDEVPQGVPIVQGRQIKPTKRPTAASLFEEAAMDDGDDDGEDEDEGEYELNSDDVIGDFDDDEDEDEEEEEEEKPAAASGKKRGAEAVTPVPSKKPKVEEKKIPASAPPKMQEQKKAAEGGAKAPPKTPETPGDAGAYEAALVKFLSSQPGKKASLSDAGQAIKRPAGVKSLSKFVSDKKKFKVDDKTISLA